MRNPDNTADRHEFQVETFVCFNADETAMIKLKFRIYATLLAISAAFLGVTFIVYIFLPKLLNLHGKTLVCHVISLFVAYSFLSAVQFATDVKMTFCKCIGKMSRLNIPFRKSYSFPCHFQLTLCSSASCQVLDYIISVRTLRRDVKNYSIEI